MSTAHRHLDPNEDHDKELARLLKLGWVKAGLAIKFDVDHSYDIPYVGGVSKDGKTIYVDRRAYPSLKRLGLIPGLVRHEQIEGILLRTGKYLYRGAHEIATAAENKVYRAQGKDVKKAQDNYPRFIRTDAKEKLLRVPADLELRPYLDPPAATALVKRMKLVMVEKEAA
jgi:hypothetical protein